MVDERSDEFRERFANRHRKLAHVTELLRTTAQELRTQRFVTHLPIWNTCLYLNLASHDLSLLVQEASMLRDNWHRLLIARHIALLLYETTEDLRSLLGKTLREALDQLGLLATFEIQLKTARKPLDAFWDAHQPALKQIRIVSAAHRDLDALNTLDVIESIDVHEFISLGTDFNKVLAGIAAALQEMLTDSSGIIPPGMKTK
jgi:hypothetical protein